MTTAEKITNWLHQTTPTPQTAAQIATGIDVSASTVRKNINKMVEAGTINVEKISNVGNYTLVETPAKVEPAPITVPSFSKPEVKVTVPAFPKPEVKVSAPEMTMTTVVVNPSAKAAPREIINKIRERAEKHRAGMNDASLAPRQRQQHRRLWAKRTARLETLQAQHA